MQSRHQVSTSEPTVPHSSATSSVWNRNSKQPWCGSCTTSEQPCSSLYPCMRTQGSPFMHKAMHARRQWWRTSWKWYHLAACPGQLFPDSGTSEGRCSGAPQLQLHTNCPSNWSLSHMQGRTGRKCSRTERDASLSCATMSTSSGRVASQ